MQDHQKQQSWASALLSGAGAAGTHHADQFIDAIPVIQPCKSINCGATDGVSHSQECVHQHDGVVNAAASADEAIEAEIQAKGANAVPSVKPADIEAQIAIEYHFNLFEATVANESGPAGEFAKGLSGKEINTLEARMQCIDQCVLILRNGYVVTGESACASAEIYDRNLGREYARANAVSKIWPLMGYELRSKLAAAS